MQNKSRVAAGILGIFLGVYGVHNFYLGYTKKAVIQLSISVGGIIMAIVSAFLIIMVSALTFGIGTILTPIIYLFCICPMASQIWGLIEGVMILSGSINVDGQGNPLID